MNYTISTDWLDQIKATYRKFSPSEVGLETLASDGVLVHQLPMPDPEVDFNLDGFNVVDAQVVISYGIVHHTDFIANSFLIPIHSEGYRFKFTDLADNVIESANIVRPVVFKASTSHSLAPFKVVKRPFIAVVLDLNPVEAIAA